MDGKKVRLLITLLISCISFIVFIVFSILNPEKNNYFALSIITLIISCFTLTYFLVSAVSEVQTSINIETILDQTEFFKYTNDAGKTVICIVNDYDEDDPKILVRALDVIEEVDAVVNMEDHEIQLVRRSEEDEEI